MRDSAATITDSYGSFYILQFLARTRPAALLKPKHWYIHAKGMKTFSWGVVLGVSYTQLRGWVSILTGPGSSSQTDKRMPTGRAGVDLGKSAHRRNFGWIDTICNAGRSRKEINFLFSTFCNILAKTSLVSLQSDFSCKYLPKERHIWRAK